MSETKKSAMKAGIGYTVGNYLVKGIGFITTPIFARLMTTADFGIYNTFLAYESILYIFIGLTLHGSLKSANYHFKGRIDEYSSSVMLMPIIMAFLGIVLVTCFENQLSVLLDLEPEIILLMIIYSYCSGLMIFYQNRIALDYNYVEYLKLSAFNVLCNVILSIILMLTVFPSIRYMGRIVGGTVAYVCLACYVIHSLIKKSKPRYNKGYWKYGLKISLPLIPHGLAQILLLQFDRIMIKKIIGNSEAGIYSFAYTIYSLIQITCASLETVFSPWVFNKMHEGEERKKIKNMGTAFMIILAGIVTAVMLLCPELILILGGKKYVDSIYCAVPVLFAGFFAMTYCIPAVIEYYKEKTGYIAMGTTMAALLNAALNIIFIPRYGYVAASYTTLFSYIIYFVLHLIISRRMSGFFMIDLKKLLEAILIIMLSFGCTFAFKEQFSVRLILVIALMLIYGLMLERVLGRETIRHFIKGKKKF